MTYDLVRDSRSFQGWLVICLISLDTELSLDLIYYQETSIIVPSLHSKFFIKIHTISKLKDRNIEDLRSRFSSLVSQNCWKNSLLNMKAADREIYLAEEWLSIARKRVKGNICRRNCFIIYISNRIENLNMETCSYAEILMQIQYTQAYDKSMWSDLSDWRRIDKISKMPFFYRINKQLVMISNFFLFSYRFDISQINNFSLRKVRDM